MPKINLKSSEIKEIIENQRNHEKSSEIIRKSIEIIGVVYKYQLHRILDIHTRKTRVSTSNTISINFT
jgi:hypothetical protein